jgi:hypothetical protein
LNRLQINKPVFKRGLVEVEVEGRGREGGREKKSEKRGKKL